jgi:hypothetical protein
LEAVVRTIDVRILVRSGGDVETVVAQLLTGVVKIHGVVELVTDGTHPHEPWPQVFTQPNVTWNGEEIDNGGV